MADPTASENRPAPVEGVMVESVSATDTSEAESEAESAVRRRTTFEWLTAGGTTPTAPRRRPWARLVIALSSSTALVAVVAVVAAAAVIPPIGARRAAREAAQRESRAQLQPREYVIASVFASQRRWTDMYRESFGVLVATDQRILYVGAPPTPLLRPRDDGPEELLVESYPYDATFTLEPRTLWRGTRRGLELRTPENTVDFLIDDATWADALTVSQLSAAARRAVTQQNEALDAGAPAPLPPPDEYVPYVVQRGENLTALARRFRTTPDVLRQLNQLTSDEIKFGQRLRVPQVRDVRAPDSLSDTTRQ